MGQHENEFQSEVTKSKLSILLYLCLTSTLTIAAIVFAAHIASIVIVYFKFGFFSSLLSWGKLFLYLEIILMGIPIAVVVWFFYHRN